jgi:UDP-N-acetylglucosamine--N-acetylmuramyl-(pentapeptide) pyrophosphoryl-undecaprenol N-acetylglucosamine transferase
MGVRVLIAGGGTGGHLFPALAVAGELKKRGAEILFVGTRAGVEARIVPQQGYPIEFINVAGFRRGRIFSNLAFPGKVAASLLESRRIIQRFKPQAALGTGGYVCGPVLLMAKLGGIPFMLQEQNSYPGVTTRILSRWARQVFLNFEEARKYFPKRARVRYVGNPVRPGFTLLDRPAAIKTWALNPNLPTLFVFGGSQGAQSLNRAVTQVLGDLSQVCNLIWSRGQRDQSSTETWSGPGALVVRPFIDDMPSAYAAGDLAVCRSGAMTLSELQAAALPAILVPFPHAAADHQKHNALSFATRGGATVIEDREFNGQRLLEEVGRLFADREKLEIMRHALTAIPKQDAAGVIAEEVIGAARNS